MKNQTYKRAALEKAFLIALLLLLVVWILRAQDAVNTTARGPAVEIYTDHGVVTESRAEIWTRLREENKPWTEPTPLPGNKDRKSPKRERRVSKLERMLASQ